MPNGSTIVLDEAMLAPGQLNETGCKGYAALRSLVECSKLPYDFTYFNVEFPLDATLISASTSASMLPFTCAVPLRVAPMPPPPPPETAAAGWREAARKYIGLVVRLQHSIQVGST